VKKYFAHLRPLERRLAIGVLVFLLLVLNYVFIWPHHSDWGNLRRRGDDARQKLKLYQTAIAQTASFEAQVKTLEGQGEFVAPEDQAINFMRSIQAQASASKVAIANYSRSMTHTNQFFSEQIQNINVIATDEQLVDFLYKLGNGSSVVRVRDLELQPDAPRQHLNANIRLVASFQKNAPAKKVSTSVINFKPATAKAK